MTRRLWMRPGTLTTILGGGEWRTFCRCGGWTGGMPFLPDWVRRSP